MNALSKFYCVKIKYEADGYDKLHRVEIVLMQEYVILNNLDIYSKLENYVYEDLCILWDGKPGEPGWEPEDFSEQASSNRVITAAKKATEARNKLNELMSEFFDQ